MGGVGGGAAVMDCRFKGGRGGGGAAVMDCRFKGGRRGWSGGGGILPAPNDVT